MTCDQCLSAEAETTIVCEHSSACLCARCADDRWNYLVVGEGFERE